MNRYIKIVKKIKNILKNKVFFTLKIRPAQIFLLLTHNDKRIIFKYIFSNLILFVVVSFITFVKISNYLNGEKKWKIVESIFRYYIPSLVFVKNKMSK